MAIRKEPRALGSHLFKDGAFSAKLTMGSNANQPVTIVYLKYALDGPPPRHWRAKPENAVELVMDSFTSAGSLEAGKILAKDVLHKLESGEITGPTRPHILPSPPESLGFIAHPAKMLKAIILRWPGEFEVRTIGYVCNGFTMPVQTPSISQDLDFEWGRLDLFERLLTDTEQEAVETAKAELERFANVDIPVKDADDPDWAQKS